MRGREPVLPKRRRSIPQQFSWVDHRLIRDGHITGRSAEALALYLFLVSVSDADGLSWYSDAALCRVLSWALPALRQARNELRSADLVAYRRPLYQVLDLSPVITMPGGTDRSGAGEAVAIGDVLKGLVSGGSQ